MKETVRINGTTVHDGDEVAVTIQGTAMCRTGMTGDKLWIKTQPYRTLILDQSEISSFTITKQAEPEYEVGQVYMSSYRSSLFRYQGGSGASSWLELASGVSWAYAYPQRPLRRVTIHDD